jgi:predicted dehydrogenase
MLEKESPDLVVLALPNEEHFAPTLKVIRAGRHLLVEKPLAFHLNEADTLLKEAEDRHLFFGINFNHRYARPVQLAQQYILAGELGEITFAIWRFGGDWQPEHPYMVLIESQCHGFDLLEHLLGPIESIMTQMTDKTGHGFRTAALALKFLNGAVGTLLGSYDSSFNYNNTHYLEINGTQGRVLIEDTIKRFTFQRPGEETHMVWQAPYFADRERSFTATLDAHLDDLLPALRAGGQPPIHARCGRRALELALAAVRSFDTGMRVNVEPHPPWAGERVKPEA